MKALVIGAALATLLIRTEAMAAVSADDFQIKTTGDLVDLCSADKTDSMYTAAVNFCHGFGAGVFQAEQLHQHASRAAPLYCVPQPMPTRDQAVAGLISWVKANPEVAKEVPASGVLHYLIETYPCPRTRR